MRMLLVCLLVQLVALPAYANSSSYEAAFSPQGGATELVVSTIQQAKKSIRVAAYSFTSKPIAEALMKAHKRGVDVKAVLDKSNLSAQYSSATFLANVGIPVRINSRYAIMHNKFILVDERTIQTGSFNYSAAAENKNAENALVIRDNSELARAYLQNWQKLWDEAEPYEATY